MKLAALFFSVTMFAQQTPRTTGSAETHGTCSPANTGSITTFNFTCSGLTAAQQKLLENIPALLNRLLASQTDNTSEILTKVDACIAGVNAVKEQQAEWRLTDGQKSELNKRAGSSKVKITFHFLNADHNASLMAIDLAASLRDWDLQSGGPDFRLNPALVGVVLVVTHKDFLEATMLQSALAGIGIAAPIEVDTKRDWVKEDDLIFVAIGSKPR